MLQINCFFRSKKNREKILNEYKFLLPKHMQLRAEKYLNETAAENFIIGRMLLREELKRMGVGEKINEIKFKKSGKPFIRDFHFNISHSEDLVVCAFANQEFGIDIEKKRELDLKNFQAFFSKPEWDKINAGKKPEELFLRYWVRKESVIKCLGITLNSLNQIETPLNSSILNFENQPLCLKEIDFGKQYFGAVCSEKEFSQINISNYESFE